MNPSDLERVARALPLFPLPRTVLMPGALLPLHVFEPRYRALVQHCLAGDRVMGVATLRPGYEADYQGSPPIYPEVGIGRVVEHQPFPDGRCNLVLSYVGRLMVESEHPSRHPFREVAGVLLRDDRTGAEPALQRLRVMILQLAALSDEARSEASRMVDLDGAEMVDSLARQLLQEADERRAYLGTERLVARVSVVEQRLSRFLAMRPPAAEA